MSAKGRKKSDITHKLPVYLATVWKHDSNIRSVSVHIYNIYTVIVRIVVSIFVWDFQLRDKGLFLYFRRIRNSISLSHVAKLKV